MGSLVRSSAVLRRGLPSPWAIEGLYSGSKRNKSEVKTWYHHYKPGPYPRTEAERRAAAKKYNMLYEDYQPYPEEKAFGDYPWIPMIHHDMRNPYEDFDFPHLRRNYGEVIHPKAWRLTGKTPNLELPPGYPPMRTMVIRHLLLVATFVLVYFGFGERYHIYTRTMPVYNVGDGRIPYSFDPAESE
ncbi:unnamed protein product [Cyprideis torosa]|uniref:Uncharacterized protein n=1 Tax=Cyprideis torosa TaxID=163714 RepID=A0A7R8W6F5_9CRUS|nr:unnamed protein product [Cyprideis torosa]CAG0881711.1 unnamed protein product [Cyprideis torosa]